MSKKQTYIAIRWNKDADWGHVSRTADSPDHPSFKGMDDVYVLLTAGYRPGLYSKKKEILSHVAL